MPAPLPPPGQSAGNGPGGAAVVPPSSALVDAAVGQWGSGASTPTLTTRFQPTQAGQTIVTPGTSAGDPVINPLNQLATAVNSESVVGVILALAAVVILYRLAHH